MAEENNPIVIERQKSDSSERTTRLGDLQEAEGHLVAAFRRMTQAFDSGLETYMKARDESIAEKGDQALADLIPNAALGLSKTFEVLAPLPIDLVNAFYPNSLRDLVEDSTRVVGRVLDTGNNDD